MSKMNHYMVEPPEKIKCDYLTILVIGLNIKIDGSVQSNFPTRDYLPEYDNIKSGDTIQLEWNNGTERVVADFFVENIRDEFTISAYKSGRTRIWIVKSDPLTCKLVNGTIPFKTSGV